MSFLIVQVYPPGPFFQSLDYLLPNTDSTPPPIGSRVLIPLRNQKIIGIVGGYTEHTQVAPHKLKWVIEVLDFEPIFPAWQRDFLSWLANYYQASLGDVYHMAMPKPIREGKPLILKKKVEIKKNKTKASFELTSFQAEAVNRILSSQDIFQTFLLHGVTGSGKTEVYLQIIETIIKNGQQALVLIPEIGLTPQTLGRFIERFGKGVLSLHSGLTATARTQAWLAAKEGTASIVIGTRSAIFAPFKNLGIIIVDEEHDASFKQQDGIRYSARDAAVVLANMLNIPIILGSATPSLESWFNVQQQKYILLDLPERTQGATLPTWHFIDLRNKNFQEGLSSELLDMIKEHLSQGNQVLIFLNRRGFSPAWLCSSCGYSPKCHQCDTLLTYHTKPAKLSCHYCGHIQKIHYECNKCSGSMQPLGLGTQRIEEALMNYFSNVPIIRIDSDTTSRKNSFEKIIEQINQGGAQILIGTQMVSKGHHFPKVSLVAVVNADSGLYSPDFRATEHLAQMLLQVSGRAGRETTLGQVCVQTYWPDHPLWQILVQKKAYEIFASQALIKRQLAALPPFRFAALLRAEGKTALIAQNFLKDLADSAKAFLIEEVSILGPIPAAQAKRAGYYRSQLLFMSKHRKKLQFFLKKLGLTITTHPQRNTVRWHLDVDPIELE